MNAREADQLAVQIARDSSGISIKRGNTNGRVCLHLTKRGSNTGTTTIYEAREWTYHPENNRTRPKRRREKEEAAEAQEATA